MPDSGQNAVRSGSNDAQQKKQLTSILVRSYTCVSNDDVFEEVSAQLRRGISGLFAAASGVANFSSLVNV